MEDSRIVELYWQRDETAIRETADKYTGYCTAIAVNVLDRREDAEECVNDTWMDAWNTMPPHRPAILATFLGKITRRIAVDKWRRQHAQKRGGGQLPLVLSELEDCIGGDGNAADAAEKRLLEETVSAFIKSLPDAERRVFLCRYWHMESVERIAGRFDFTPAKVKSLLHRTRGKLRSCLEKEGLL